MDRERVCFLLPVGLVFTAVDLTSRYSFVVCFVKGMNQSIKNFFGNLFVLRFFYWLDLLVFDDAIRSK